MLIYLLKKRKQPVHEVESEQNKNGIIDHNVAETNGAIFPQKSVTG